MAPARIMNPILPLSTAEGDGSSAHPLNRLQQVSNMLQEVRSRVTVDAAGLLPTSSSHTAGALPRPSVHWGFGSRAVENITARPSPSSPSMVENAAYKPKEISASFSASSHDLTGKESHDSYKSRFQKDDLTEGISGSQEMEPPHLSAWGDFSLSRVEEEGSCPHWSQASTSLDAGGHTSPQQTNHMTDSLTQSQSDRSQYHCNSSAPVHTTKAGLRVHRSSPSLSIPADGVQHMLSRPCQGETEEQLSCRTVSSDILSREEASKGSELPDGNLGPSPSRQRPIAIAPVLQESDWSLAVEPGGSWADETIIPAAPSPDSPKRYVPATMPLFADGESLPFSLDTSSCSNRNDGGQQPHSGVIDVLTERSGGSAVEQATRTGASNLAQPEGSEKEVEDDIEAGRNSETAAAVHETVQKLDGNESLLPSPTRLTPGAMSSPVDNSGVPDPSPSGTSALSKPIYRRRRPTVQQQIEITLPPPPQRRRKSTLICDGRVPSSVLRARFWFLSTLSHAPSSAGAHIESDGSGERNAANSTSRQWTEPVRSGPSACRPTRSTLAVNAEGLGNDRQSRLIFSETRRLSERSVVTPRSVSTMSSERRVGESRSPRYVEIDSDSSDTDSEALWQPGNTKRQLAQTTYRKPLRSRAHALHRSTAALGKSKGKESLLLGRRRSQLRAPRLVLEDEAEDSEPQSAHTSSGQVEAEVSLVPSEMPTSLREHAQRKVNGISGNGRPPSPSEKTESSGLISICDKDNRRATSDGRALMGESSGILQSVTDSEQPTKVRSLPRLLPLQAGVSTLEALKRLKRLPVAAAPTPSAVYSPEAIEKSVPSENPNCTLLSAHDLEDLRQLREEQEEIKEEQAWLQEQHRCDEQLPIESVTDNVDDESNTESSTRDQVQDETDSWREPRLQLADSGAGSEQRLYDEKEGQRKEMRPLGKFVGDLLHWARNSDAASANPNVPGCNPSLQASTTTEESDRQRNTVTTESTAPTTASKRRVASDDGPSHDGHEVLVGSNVITPNKKAKLDHEEGRKRLARLLKAIGD